MPLINPLTPDYWIYQRLSGSTAAAAFCGVRIAPARQGFDPREFLTTPGAAESSVWPYILFGPARDGFFDNYAQESTLLDGEYLIRAFHREDFCTPQDVEAANGIGQMAILELFQGVQDGIVDNDVSGEVHGCQIVRPHRRLYLPPGAPSGPRTSEMGVIVRIFST